MLNEYFISNNCVCFSSVFLSSLSPFHIFPYTSLPLHVILFSNLFICYVIFFQISMVIWLLNSCIYSFANCPIFHLLLFYTFSVFFLSPPHSFTSFLSLSLLNCPVFHFLLFSHSLLPSLWLLSRLCRLYDFCLFCLFFTFIFAFSLLFYVILVFL